jgi:hypothetical protein
MIKGQVLFNALILRYTFSVSDSDRFAYSKSSLPVIASNAGHALIVFESLQ